MLIYKNSENRHTVSHSYVFSCAVQEGNLLQLYKNSPYRKMVFLLCEFVDV